MTVSPTRISSSSRANCHSRAAVLFFKLGGEVSFELAVKQARRLEVGPQFGAMIEDITVRLPAGDAGQLDVFENVFVPVASKIDSFLLSL